MIAENDPRKRCPEMQKPGGCQLPNVHCGAPDCWRQKRPSPPVVPVEVLRMERRYSLYERIGAELDRAYGKHGAAQWGRHEFYGILKEEVDELWADIKSDAPQDQLEKELVQVAAMCFRYFETRDRYREPAAA